ncbi:MAG TPA: hypothetical protein VGR51_09260 [Thermoplasmata archaeon]|nr:hypothetical protein [Thermoplasmata archaeon]
MAASIVLDLVGLLTVQAVVHDFNGQLMNTALQDPRWATQRLLSTVSLVLLPVACLFALVAAGAGGASLPRRLSEFRARPGWIIALVGVAILAIGGNLTALALAAWPADTFTARYLGSREFADYFSAAFPALIVRSVAFLVIFTGITIETLRMPVERIRPLDGEEYDEDEEDE